MQVWTLQIATEVSMISEWHNYSFFRVMILPVLADSSAARQASTAARDSSGVMMVGQGVHRLNPLFCIYLTGAIR